LESRKYCEKGDAYPLENKNQRSEDMNDPIPVNDNEIAKANIDTAVKFLEEMKENCPNIKELGKVIEKIKELIKKKTLFKSDKIVDRDAKSSGESKPSSWKATTNSEGTYIRPGTIGKYKYDLAKHGIRDASGFAQLLDVLIHEIFHQLKTNHPDTYKQTAALLDELSKCLRKSSHSYKKEIAEQLDIWKKDELNSVGQPTADNRHIRRNRAIGVVVGGLAGGYAGAKIGAAIGTAGGPIGTAVGAVAGAVIGWGISKLFD
jgi:hypothetical protein